MATKMSLGARKELITNIRLKYHKSSWQKKCKILDGFVAATGYKRKYAISLLNLIEADRARIKPQQSVKAKYNQAVKNALIVVWHAANEICAKRLVPFLPELVAALERYGHLSLTKDIREKLLSISAATVDRLLKPERQEYGKGISTTRSGSLLKKQIKVRTFADWDDVVPGFLEGDLVAHCGDNAEGSFLNTLVLTDIASCWTEFLPLLCKSSAGVISGISIVKELLPFALLGVDTDNGSEFINYELLNFCKDNQITFTRSRAYKKNDQAHVEEKNGSIVRRLVGYDRYEGSAAWCALADLYAVLRLYVNYFQPSLKLISKKRDGAKVTKKYDKARTPCQRLIDSENLSPEIKAKLKNEYESLDPINLLERLNKCQEAFWKHAWSSENNIKEVFSIGENSLTPKQIAVDELAIANPNTNRKYRYTKKPREKMSERTWRTRKDPFDIVWNQLRLQLEVNPQRTAKGMLDTLITEQPENFTHKLLRTLQRRVAAWRMQQYNEMKKQRIIFPPQNDMTNKYLSLVMAVENG